jgi:hypothetical protein
MAASCRRLLAALLLIFAAPMLLGGQDSAADRSFAGQAFAGLASADRASARAPVVPLGAKGADVFHELVFRQLVRAAGIIFSGRVTSIGRSASSSGLDPASTVVTFQVEHAIRGTLPGQNLTIHEWTGLRFRGEHYRVGERVLLFLYSPSKLGLTSPVAGAMGRFAMNAQGRIVMSAQHVAALATDPILGGKTVVPYSDFALAVRRSSGEE